MGNVVIEPELKLLNRLLSLSRLVGSHEIFEKAAECIFSEPRESPKSQKDACIIAEASSYPKLPPKSIIKQSLRTELLIGLLEQKLKAIKPDDPAWYDYFLVFAFVSELSLSPWGNLLLLYGKQQKAISPDQLTVSRLPYCLFPRDCLICNADINIAAEKYKWNKRGLGTILCYECSQVSTGNQAFTAISIPDFMLPYQNIPARDRTNKVADAMRLIHKTPDLESVGLAKRQELLLIVKDAYAFFLSQYGDRAYRPRYSLLYPDFPNIDWIYNLFFVLARGEKLYIKRQDPYVAQGFQYIQRPDQVRQVLVPPMFKSEVEAKWITSTIQPETIPLQNLDKYFILP